MPIKVKSDLPAIKILEDENIFTMTEKRALTQDIRPLKIVILNLMPTKIQTETQLLRILGNSPLQVDIELMQTATYSSKNTSPDHLVTFYKTLDDIKDKKYDGMIVTGAPVETLNFEEVDYWDELKNIFDWQNQSVYSTLNICWGAQASLYYNYGILKHMLPQKLSGVYRHTALDVHHPLMRGLDDVFHIPHSCNTYIKAEDIEKAADLEILAKSDLAGVSIACNRNGREFFLFGHSEYDRDTLAQEYYRDKNRGLDPSLPYNYFPENNPTKRPVLSWRNTAMLLFTNWLNYYVYQQTPYDLKDLKARAKKLIPSPAP